MTEENAVVQELDKTGTQVDPKESDATGVDPQGTQEQGENEPGNKRKGGWQRKIEKLERQNEYLMNQVLGTPRTAPAPEPKVEAKARPVWSEYETAGKQEQYFDDLADWKVEQKLKAYEDKQAAESKKRETETEQTKAQQRFSESAIKFKADHPDFDQVLKEANPSPLLSSLVLRNKDAASLAYHLASNPDEEHRLSQLTDPVEVAEEIGLIRAQLAKPEPAAEEREIPPIPTAPPPITPVRKVTPGTDKGLSDDLPMKEWSKRYTAQMEKAKKK